MSRSGQDTDAICVVLFFVRFRFSICSQHIIRGTFILWLKTTSTINILQSDGCAPQSRTKKNQSYQEKGPNSSNVQENTHVFIDVGRV